jgi:hypothetical protein
MSAEKTIAKLLIKIGVSVEGAKKAQDEIDDTTDSAEKTDKKGSPKLQAFAKAAKVAFGGVAVAAAASSGAILAAGAAAFSFATEQTKAMDEIAKGAKTLALSTDEYQRLTQVAGHTGTSVEDLGAGIRKLNADMLTIASGTGDVFEQKLAKIGLTSDMLDGKTTTESIGLIGDALNLIEEPAIRAARAAEIFGEDAGPKLANVLAAGTAGLQEMSAAAQGVFAPEDLAKAEQFQYALGDFKSLLSGVAGELAVALAPAITAVVDAISTFVAENQDLIKQQLPKILTSVLDNATKLLPIMLEVAGSVADLVVQAQPLIDQFVDFTSGSLESGMRGVLSVMEALLPIILAVTGTIMEAVGGVETLSGYGKTGPRGAPGFKSDELKGQVPDKSKKAAGESWAKDRQLSEKEIADALRRKIDTGEASSINEGIAQLKEDYAPVLSFAQMGQQARAKKAQREAMAEEAAKKKGKGGGKKKKAEKVSASFGDYRDVLATYQGTGPEDSLKALEALEKGVMPKDHKPETSITITNNITNHVDVGGIAVNGAGSPLDVAKAVDARLAQTYKAVAANTPNNMVR